MALVLYQPFHEIRLTGKKLGDQIHPYFQRGGTRFCSHNNTPANYADVVPAITEGRDGIYVAAAVFSDYAACGSLSSKQIVLPLLAKLCPEKIVEATNVPSSGKVVLYEKDGAFLCHALYANTVKRGEKVEVIEDLVTLADIYVTLRLPRAVTSAVSRPDGKELPLVQNADGTVTVTLERLHCSAIIELK